MIEKAGAAAAPVALAIERASLRTGADFDYLFKTAVRESSLDPSAKARSSSAAGLFQFIEQTWLGMVKNHGAEHGLGYLADQITQTKGGRYTVADRQIRQDILALRYDPEIAATMAGEFTRESADTLKSVLGREPTGGELYVAHFLGPAGASELIRSAQRGEASAADIFPDAARANRSIFYARSGEARTSAEVLALLQNKHDGLKAPQPSGTVDMMLAGLRPAQDMPLGAAGGADDWMPAYAAFQADAGRMQGGAGGKAGPLNTVTPFMAQLLASLDPIPDRAQGAMLRDDRELRRSLTEA